MDDQAPPSGEQPRSQADGSTTTPGAGGASPQSREPSGPAGERIQGIIQAAEKAAAGIIEDADAQARRYIDTSRERADALADERVRMMSDLTETLVRQAELVRRQSDELLSALDSARNELASKIGKELAPPASASAAAPAAEPPAPIADAPPPEPIADAPPPEQPPAQSAAPASEPPPGATRVPHLQPVESKAPDLKPVPSAPEPGRPDVDETSEQPTQSQAPPGAPAAPEPPAQPASKPPPSAPPPPTPPIASTGGAATPSDGARLLAAQMAVAGSSRSEIEARLQKEFGIQDASPILDGILGPS